VAYKSEFRAFQTGALRQEGDSIMSKKFKKPFQPGVCRAAALPHASHPEQEKGQEVLPMVPRLSARQEDAMEMRKRLAARKRASRSKKAAHAAR
jgi:hypothetical protein